MQVKDHIRHYTIDADLFDYFEESDKLENDYNNRLYEFIKKFISGKKNKILDIGSGKGWTVSKFSDQNLTLMDISSKNLRSIRENNQKTHVEYIVGDALSLPFKKESFDIVVISEVLEHINSPSSVIKNAYFALRKGGKIIITTPYNEKIKYYLCIHCNQKTPANAHIHSFNEKNLTEILDKLNIQKYRYYKIGCKYFLRSRLSYFLKYLPFFMWKLIDNIFIFLFNKPVTIIIEITKI